MHRSGRPADSGGLRFINIDLAKAAEFTDLQKKKNLFAGIKRKGYSLYDTNSLLRLRRNRCEIFTEARMIDFTVFRLLFNQVCSVEMTNPTSDHQSLFLNSLFCEENFLH